MASGSLIPWCVGWNDRDPAATLEAGWLRVARNIIALSGHDDSPVTHRPPLVRFATGAFADEPCQGLFAFLSSGAIVLLYAGDNNHLYLSGDLDTPLTLAHTWAWAADDLFQVVRHKQQLYIVNGSDTVGQYGTNMRVQIGTTVARPMGCIKPAAAPTVAHAGAGIELTGEYSWVYSYYDSTLDRESDFSDPVTHTFAAEKAQLTLVESADSTFDKMRIYRTATGGSTYGLEEEIASATSHDVSAADSALGDQPGDDTGTQVFTHAGICKCIFVLGDGEGARIGLANDVTAGLKRRIHICYDKDNPEAFPAANDLDAGPENGYEIVAVVPYGDEGVVICEDGIWVINATCTECNGRIQGTGGVGPHAACASPYGVFYASYNGVELFTGYSLRKPRVSDVIAGTWAEVVRSRLHYCQMAYDTELDHLFVAVCTTDEGTQNDTLLALDCRTLDRPDPRWYEWPIRAEGMLHAPAAAAGDAKTYICVGQGVVASLEGLGTVHPDLVPSGTSRGSVASATSTTLTDTDAAFVTTGVGLKGCDVYITSGRGAGQRRIVASNTATALTVTAAWTTNPDDTSTYQVGAVKGQMTTGGHGLDAPGKEKIVQRVNIFVEQP